MMLRVTVVLLLGCAAFFCEATNKPAFCNDLDCPPYTVKESTPDYELREYSSTAWVQTTLTGIDLNDAQSQIFMKLFRYISGENEAKAKIAMTAPVLVRIIPGQGPACENNFTMSFYVAQDNVPQPTNPDVSLVTRPAMSAYVKSFPGFAKQQDYIRTALELGEALTSAGKSYISSFYYTAGYDAPYKLFNRHNEVWFLTSQQNLIRERNAGNSSVMLFDFTTLASLENWHEVSDTAREVGMSKASLVLQKTQIYQRAIFFALLNPQPNGACFAGFETEVDLDTSRYTAIQIRLKGAQGDLFRYKLLLTHKNQTAQRSYESFFNITELCDCVQDEGACHCDHDVILQLNGFKAYYRGKLDPSAPPLSSMNVGSVSIQAAGGVYEEEKQRGVGAIEIESIKLLI